MWVGCTVQFTHRQLVGQNNLLISALTVPIKHVQNIKRHDIYSNDNRLTVLQLRRVQVLASLWRGQRSVLDLTLTEEAGASETTLQYVAMYLLSSPSTRGKSTRLSPLVLANYVTTSNKQEVFQPVDSQRSLAEPANLLV